MGGNDSMEIICIWAFVWDPEDAMLVIGSRRDIQRLLLTQASRKWVSSVEIDNLELLFRGKGIKHKFICVLWEISEENILSYSRLYGQARG